ncbi:putative tellurite resistance protein B-like protein [Haloferula luteola]|uniref:Putative tellurite resistance protein B-like protein n=1 Tax=Haloferula luteola TaxID=595692 RepID=A0A840V4F4_9BACT|nr:TerB family tellurite resistance protein [Haloferula luteola]MBB5352895.1 putative tellurite resistance protein B-like protein [Haloferula luteola]
MIIFGTRGVTTTPEKGVFWCPSCGPGSAFKRKRVRRFFTLYFIPIIPLNVLGEYIECGQCKSQYHLDVLQFDPGKQAEAFEVAFHAAARKLMIAMVLTDGSIDAAESAEVCRLYEEMTGRPMYPGDVNLEAADFQSAGLVVPTLLAEVAPRLSDGGREKLFEVAWRVATANGPMNAQEAALLDQVADSVGLTASHRQGLASLLQQQGRLPVQASPPPLPGFASPEKDGGRPA